MRQIKIETHQYYHVYNRGAGKQEIFQDERDYFRFLRKIWELNNTTGSEHRDYLLRKLHKDSPDLGYPRSGLSLRFSFKQYFGHLIQLPKIVEIIAYCFLPNHYHFIFKQLVDSGIEYFMRRLGISYAMYFNRRHNRTGVLFERHFKAYPIYNENKFAWLSAYVNGNYQIHKLGRAESRQFSSYPDYLNLRSGKLAHKDVILKLFRNTHRYKQYCQTVIKEVQDIKKAAQILLTAETI